jgi:hypothetical protein
MALAAVVGAAAALGSLGMSAYSAFGPHDGPDYSNATNQFNARNKQIESFASSLADARTKYLSSLNNMYNDAYSRFSGNAEAGFANRGMAVNGGAFASALAKKSAEYQSQLTPEVYKAESADLRSVDAAYGQNSGSYMSAISGGPGIQYQGDRQDMGSFAQLLGKYSQPTISGWMDNGSGGGGYNAYSGTYGNTTPNTNSYPVTPTNRLGLDYNQRVS